MRRTLIPMAALTAALVLGACSDGGTSPGSGNGGDTRSIVDDPSLASVIQEIFNRNGCSSGPCHGTAVSAGLDLTDGSSYGNLVGVIATQTSVARVVPNNASGSYLIVKVEGLQITGERMPLGRTPLDNIDVTNLKNWINQGARNN